MSRQLGQHSSHGNTDASHQQKQRSTSGALLYAPTATIAEGGDDASLHSALFPLLHGGDHKQHRHQLPDAAKNSDAAGDGDVMRVTDHLLLGHHHGNPHSQSAWLAVYGGGGGVDTTAQTSSYGHVDGSASAQPLVLPPPKPDLSLSAAVHDFFGGGDVFDVYVGSGSHMGGAGSQRRSSLAQTLSPQLLDGAGTDEDIGGVGGFGERLMADADGHSASGGGGQYYGQAPRSLPPLHRLHESSQPSTTAGSRSRRRGGAGQHGHNDAGDAQHPHEQQHQAHGSGGNARRHAPAQASNRHRGALAVNSLASSTVIPSMILPTPSSATAAEAANFQFAMKNPYVAAPFVPRTPSEHFAVSLAHFVAELSSAPYVARACADGDTTTRRGSTATTQSTHSASNGVNGIHDGFSQQLLPQHLQQQSPRRMPHPHLQPLAPAIPPGEHQQHQQQLYPQQQYMKPNGATVISPASPPVAPPATPVVRPNPVLINQLAYVIAHSVGPSAPSSLAGIHAMYGSSGNSQGPFGDGSADNGSPYAAASSAPLTSVIASSMHMPPPRSAGLPTNIDVPDDGSMDAATLKRLRNRVSASRCRQKKRVWVQELEKVMAGLTAMKPDIEQYVRELEQEKARLVNLIRMQETTQPTHF